MNTISQTAEYALRAVVCLAARPERHLTTREIAEITQVPADYLSKVLQTLVRGKIVRSRRGLGGGFTLCCKAGELTILDVVAVVDPIQRIRECPLHLEAHRDALCPLHRRLDEAMAAIEDSLRNTTLAEIMSDPDDHVPLGRVAPEDGSWGGAGGS
ncbi:MAG: Rrf2 family transcriptional regulator [Acidobacteria bacterium]|nr:Rrf2 family transcriptional regulator [Acidobacteriota bacterium]